MGAEMTGSTMNAVRFHGADQPLRVDEVPVPDPGPHDVLLRVAACGLCGSDVHFLEGMPTPGPLPLTLGHEPAGTVVATGAEVTGWSKGERVAITLDNGCGKCRTCTSGWPEACRLQSAPGLHFDGAFADLIRVPASTLVRVPEGVSMTAAAVATDCVASPYHALKCRGRLVPGEQVVIVGVGGLGSMGILLARKLGAERIVAVDASPAALDRAASAGADATVLVPAGAQATDVAGEVIAATGGGAEVAMECVGHSDTLSLAVQALVPGGRMVAVGIGMEPPPIPYPQALFALWEFSVIGSFGSHKRDLEEVLAMTASGDLDIDAGISHRVTLDQVAEGYEMLREHRDDPQRIVMVAREEA